MTATNPSGQIDSEDWVHSALSWLAEDRRRRPIPFNAGIDCVSLAIHALNQALLALAVEERRGLISQGESAIVGDRSEPGVASTTPARGQTPRRSSNG
jgi:hypothetical protein